MKKKVGIITFHNAHNYGAVLQAFALNKKLIKLGVEPGFINVVNSNIEEDYSLFPKRKNNSYKIHFKKLISLLLDFRRKKRRFEGFTNFINKKLPVYEVSAKEKFDSVILGSDQIWNFNITNGIDPLFFGQNDNIETNNVISYAASMGNAMLENNFTSDYKMLLSKLNHIGVREESLGNNLTKYFDLSCEINLDPTLLLDKSDWEEIETDSGCESGYILIYQVEEHPNAIKTADFIGKKLNFPIKIIASKTDYKISKNIITTASPGEFISLVKNASFVITSSFHGTVFSIINEIPFYTLKFNNGVDARSAGLLNVLEISERHIDNINDRTWERNEIDFVEVNRKLTSLKEKSENYLRQAIF
jgi:hypothetical protein